MAMSAIPLHRLRAGGVAMPCSLNVGDAFPRYDVRTVQGESLHLPDDLSGDYSVVLFYRGHW
jgi:hypothetical protein